VALQPPARKHAFIEMVRNDVFLKWGWPPRAQPAATDDSERVSLHLPKDPDVAKVALGSSGPVREVLPQADSWVKFCGVPLPFVPASIRDVVDDETITKFRGALQLMHEDFQHRVKRR
jgi:hypothetical protein